MCLIANRGEIAVRIIRACRELGIRTVAVYSEVDAGAQHVQLADVAYPLGGVEASASYLNIAKLLTVAREAGCDCVHPGYGFLSESVDFAQAVIDAGLTWVGPPPAAMWVMGFKTEARAAMQQAGVPLVPGWSPSENPTDEMVVAAAASIGYPVMVKASAGGGGKGIRIVHHADELMAAWQTAGREAQSAFGDGRLFLEKYIESGRHIEMQILADQYGHVLHLFERECSAQRRHQKVIEESPAPNLSDAVRQQMSAAAVQAAQAVNYVNAGTVEFILTPNDEFYFLEMNTRLQVEHPVTELVTGLDLVKLQFAIAAGEPLPFTQADLTQRGHAIECRLYAEDPYKGFLPSIGTVQRFNPPQAPGIRVDSGIRSGDAITIHYDPMIAKLIVYDATRAGAVRRMQEALAQTVILGTTTNLDFLQMLVQHPAFQAGQIDTNFIDTHLEALLPAAPALPFAALIIAALNERYNSSHSIPQGDDPWSRADSFRLGIG